MLNALSSISAIFPRSTFLTILAIYIIGTSHDLHAAGFALIEHSASGMGNAFAGGAAAGDDASDVYFNPASMTIIDRTQIVVTGHKINPSFRFTDRGSHLSNSFNQQAIEGRAAADGGVPALVPNFYSIVPINQKFLFGFSLNAPFGLSVKYDDDWLGRYHAVDSELATLNINPSLAYKVSPTMSIGLGVSLQRTSVRLSSAVDFAALFSGGTQRTKNDGFAEISGDNNEDLSFGWNFGLMINVDQETRFGMSYRSSIVHKVKGYVDFTVPGAYAAFLNGAGTFNDGAVTAEVNFPASLSVSALRRYGEKFTFMADITWTGWSVFDELRIVYDKTNNPSQPDSVTTEDWQDSYRYSLGMNYQAYPTWLLRWGLALDQSPVPNAQRRTARIPDNDRIWASFGMSHQVNQSMSWDLGYSHLRVRNAEINNTLESDKPALQSTLVGSYQGSVDIFSLQFIWNLD